MKKGTTAVESDELHLFEPKEIDVVHDVVVIVTGRLDGGGSSMEALHAARMSRRVVIHPCSMW